MGRGSFQNRSGREGISGFTLLDLLIVVGIIAILTAMAIPRYLDFVQRARETAVIAFLRELILAEEAYRIENGVEAYVGDFEELEKTGYIPDTQNVKGPKKPGKKKGIKSNSSRIQHAYQFDLTASQSGPYTWYVYASPTNKSPSVRWFYTDQTGVIRYAVGSKAGPDSPPIGD